MQKDLSQRFLQGRGVWRESDFLGLPIHPRIELWSLLFPGELSPFRKTFEKQMNLSTLLFFLHPLPLIQCFQDTPNTPGRLVPLTKLVPWDESTSQAGQDILSQPLTEIIHSFQTSNYSDVYHVPGPTGDTVIKLTAVYSRGKSQISN